MKVTNKESDNYTAEYILRALAAERGGAANSAAGLDAVEKFLGKQSIGSDQIRIKDGCGLARQNLVSTEGIARLLATMYHHPYFAVFEQSLAVSGHDGTLADRLSSPEFRGRVHAKTGTMTGVSSLAGYAYPASGDTLGFAIICNNFVSSPRVVRAVQDQLIARALTPAIAESGP
jgi:D-alanyl-D-alanine carboxypeptidase/D-alanyl-D-alanine-endopeptidase (penicillin-binding protein 4)